MKYLLTIAVILGATNAAHAGREGGGTNGVVIDDRVISADSLRPGLAGSRCEFSLELKALLERAGLLLVRYGANQRAEHDNFIGPFTPEQSKFIEENVRSSDTEYRCVTELPKFAECQDEFKIHDKQVGRSVPLACTIGPVTWLRPDLFNKMPLREQTKVIIHERLHNIEVPGLNREVTHAMIADVTNSLGLLLGLYNDQLLGARPVLNDLQVGQITVLVHRIAQLKLNSERPDIRSARGDLTPLSSQYVVTPFGGGLVRKINRYIPSGAYVGVGSILRGTIENDAELIDTVCYDPRPQYHIDCTLKRGAKLKSVMIRAAKPGIYVGLHVGERSTLSDVGFQIQDKNNQQHFDQSHSFVISSFKDRSAILIGQDTQIKNFESQGLRSISIGSNTRIENFALEGLAFWRSNFASVALGENSRLVYNGNNFRFTLIVDAFSWYATLPSRVEPHLNLGPNFAFDLAMINKDYAIVRAIGRTNIDSMKALKNKDVPGYSGSNE
jgi:hypothetical protein